MIKRLLVLLAGGVALVGMLLLFPYDVIKISWVSFMAIQPSFKPMENPLPVPPNSNPVEGPAYIAGMGAPVNPVTSDQVSITRGAQLFKINCVICHGQGGMGDGVIGTFFENKPANLTGPVVQNLSDGAIFLVISTGVAGRMPPLNENLAVRDRWDVVNYIRTLIK